MTIIDYLIIFLYLGAMLFLSYKLSIRESLEAFFVNNRKTKTALLVFTFLSSAVGMGVILGGASEGYKSGISFPLLMAVSSVTSLFLVWLFASRIKRFGDNHRAYTIADFFGVRFSPANRAAAAFITLITYFLWTALQFVALASLSHVILGFDFVISLVAVSVITIVYTSLSGIRSDFYTDAVHFWVMFVVLYVIMIPLIILNSGFAVLSSLPDSYFSPFSFFGSPWMTLLALLLVIPYALSSMDVWQRIYAAESEKMAKKTLAISAFLLVPAILLPGVAGIAIYSLSPGLNPNDALFSGMSQMLPPVLLGLGLAGILAAAMSTINTMLIVCSATFTKDIYKSFLNKGASEQGMLLIARVSLGAFGLASLIAAYLFNDIINLFLAAAYTVLVLGPALLGAFIWKTSTSKASFLSIVSGFAVLLAAIPFMAKNAFAPALLVSLIVFVLVSLFTQHSSSENLTLVD